jgi:dolichyl-phosphate beta-glucosyltransferase
MLPEVIERIRAWVSNAASSIELVLVENGSSDETLAIAVSARDTGIDGARIEVIALPVGDYGAAVRAGLEASRGDIVAVLDCDMVDTMFVDRCRVLLDDNDGLGAVLASKRAEGSNDKRSLYRRTGTMVFSALVRLLTGSSLLDTHGNKVLRGEPARALLAAVGANGSLFDTELLVRMERAGWTFTELPATVVETRPPRSSYLARVPSTLLGLLRLRRRIDH